MHLLGLTFVYESFEQELQTLYQKAKAGNFWGNSHYAMTNHKEYFAEGVQSYLDANKPSENHGPSHREELISTDPELYTFLKKYLGDNSWRWSC